MNIGSVITRPPITEHEIETTSSAKPPSAGTAARDELFREHSAGILRARVAFVETVKTATGRSGIKSICVGDP